MHGLKNPYPKILCRAVWIRNKFIFLIISNSVVKYCRLTSNWSGF